MAIQDSDPERRNLVVTSLAFITFFFAGGSFPDSSVRLQVINADFSKPEILSYIAWCTFCWFIYRYWLTHRGNFASGFNSDFNEWRNKYYITNYINNHFNQKMHPNESTQEYHAVALGWSGGSVMITCNFANVSRDANGKLRSTGSISGKASKKTEFIKLTKFKGWLLAARATGSCILTKPSFANYLVPYILAIIAIVGATCRYSF